MSFRELTTGAYLKLHEAMEAEDSPRPIPLLGYDHLGTSSDFIYDWLEQDYTRELVNLHNQLAYWHGRLTLWESVLRSYTEDEVAELRMEFTTLQLDYCLSAPYRFKSRVAFCATQLCYTKGIAEKLFASEAVLPEDKLNLNSLRAVAKYWSTGQQLVDALSEVDADDFRSSIANYRNKAQHRHPQRLDWGHTSAVVRDFPEKALIGYSFGQAGPLLTSDALPILAKEAERMKLAFNAYRALVEEQCANKSQT